MNQRHILLRSFCDKFEEEEEMGSSSSSSRHAVASSSTSSSSSYSSSSSLSIGRRSRSMGTRVFQSSCLGGGGGGGRSSGSYETDNDDQVVNNRNKEIGSLNNESECIEQTSSRSVQMKREFCRKVKLPQQQTPTEVLPCISSDGEFEEWGQESVTHGVTRPDIISSSSQVVSSRSLITSSRPRSRFSCIPGNISFRLSRAASLGSSRTCSLFSSGLTVSNAEEDVRVHTIPTSSSINRNGAHQGSNLLPVCSSTRLASPHLEETSSSDDVLCLEPPLPGVPVHLQDDEIISAPDMVRLDENIGFPTDTDDHSSRNPTEIENAETRRLDRRIRAREPVERSVRFSRTLSVGRLRDRVLRRSSFSDALFGRLQEDREVRDSSQDNEGQVWGDITRSLDSNGNAETTQVSSSFPPSGGDLNSLFNNHDYDMETSRSREARYHDMMERRTDFLERRRRIRSQVRALQRLGSRFENLSGHERSCILSGQHRTGRCTCRTNNRTTNPDDDTSARASISRIVMLAEALFEVLDEIHQQSVVLSTRPSVSSIGSVPAPKEVVEAMPVKIHTKSQKHQNDDAAQCYICLVEYDEGDCIRILPCHHEFHQTCIDKWLKEIHRVCPLCRGDVCRSDSFAAEN